jgi:hypothetical protein
VPVQEYLVYVVLVSASHIYLSMYLSYTPRPVSAIPPRVIHALEQEERSRREDANLHH